MSYIPPWLYVGLLDPESRRSLEFDYAMSNFKNTSSPSEELYHEQAPGYPHWSRNSDLASVRKECNKFQINLDVKNFAPNEVKVKTVDNFVTIEAKHEEKRDEYGLVSRQFVRRYVIPDGCSPNLVESRLSSDGVLTIVAQRAPPVAKDERAFPVAIPMEARHQPSVSNSSDN